MSMLRKSILLLQAFLILLITASCTTVRHTEDSYHIKPLLDDATYTRDGYLSEEGAVKVMALNLAHGRGTGFHQLFSTTNSIRTNLDRVATVIRRQQPYVVALQEADGASAWSGGFNHVEYILNRTYLISSYQGLHVQTLEQQYGTALLAGNGLDNRLSHAFRNSSIIPPRGFVVATVTWPGRDDLLIDVVSVHLDFLSGNNRYEQAQDLVAALDSRERPLILMGDLNSEWHKRDDVLAYLTKTLGLSAYQPENKELATLPSFNKRIDWILISEEFEFIDYKVLTDELSDHQAVIADIQFNQ